MNKNDIIIGMGDGAEQSHYTRKPFWKVNIKSTTKICERCSKVPVFGRQRFCANCVKIRARDKRYASMWK